MDKPDPTTPKRVAMVIGAGSVMCAASLGLWKVLQREAIDICMAVGCSGGSIYAGVIALGYDIATAEALTLDLWKSDLYEGYTHNLRSALAGESQFNERSGLIDDRVLLERLGAVFGEHTFAETRIPLYIVSTDLYTGEGVVHSSGRILDAVRASLAIPLIFPPWEIGERLLVDGAVSDPLPVGTFDTHLIPYIVEMGTRAAEEQLPYINRLLTTA